MVVFNGTMKNGRTIDFRFELMDAKKVEDNKPMLMYFDRYMNELISFIVMANDMTWDDEKFSVDGFEIVASEKFEEGSSYTFIRYEKVV
jgi:hypothetical protein